MVRSKPKKLESTVQVKTSTKLLDQLEAIAQKNTIPRTALIRLVLQRYVDDEGDKLINLSSDLKK